MNPVLDLLLKETEINNSLNPVLDLPHTLDLLLKETEINNSFTVNDVHNHLKDSMESSYAHLYRFQKDAINYKRFEYRTKQILLDTTFNDVEKYEFELKKLKESESENLERISFIEDFLEKYRKVDFGDIYLDFNKRVCIDLPIDIVHESMRREFRKSKYYLKDISFDEILSNQNLFYIYPILIIDGSIYKFDVFCMEKGTKLIIKDFKTNDLYNYEGSQIFHEVCVLFIDNTYFKCEENIPIEDILYGSIPVTDIEFEDNGLFFIAIQNSDRSFSHLIGGCFLEDSIMMFDDTNLGNKLTSYLGNLKDNGINSVNVNIYFFKNFYSYDYNCTKSCIETDVKKVPMTSLNGVQFIWLKYESELFIPKQNDEILSMPIPESNFLVMKAIYEDDEIDHYDKSYKVSVKLYYPNIYQVDDSMEDRDSYIIYYAYSKDNDKKYTPLFSFYMEYLKHRYNYYYSAEKILNMIYFKHEEYLTNLSVDEDNPLRTLRGDVLNEFYDLFNQILNYKDYGYKYWESDFINDYGGDDISLQYKIARMMEFIQADYNILPEYVKRQKTQEHIFHFFTNTINLSGRFRRSTRNEDPENIKVFADGCEKVESATEGALRVSSSLSYNKDTEVYIDDVKPFIPDINDGEYVKFTDLIERYVFAISSSANINRATRIYIDGFLMSDIEIVNEQGMQFIYIPTKDVTDNSYIMMENEYYNNEPLVVELTFTDNSEWQDIHLIESPDLIYTMDDVVLWDNDTIIPKDQYTLKLVRKMIPYSMEDERHEVINKFGIVTDVSLQLTNMDITNFKVTVEISKTYLVVSKRVERNTYPRVNIVHGLKPDDRHVRQYKDGRLMLKTSYRNIESCNRNYIQSRLFCKKGSTYTFEFNPHARELIYEVAKFNQDELFNISDYIDKPLDISYYEIYVNGRRLGLPNLFSFGPYHSIFKGLESDVLLEIYEKERDFEYFGYSKIDPSLNGDKFKFFFTVEDLIHKSFLSEEEINAIISNYVEMQKNENVIIKENVSIEEPIDEEIENGLLEEMKIFFFEELLQLSFGNPNSKQFIAKYLSEVFPNFFNEFVVDVNDTKVVFLDPDKTYRFRDKKSNEYEIIDTSDANPDNQFVMLTGESGYKK